MSNEEMAARINAAYAKIPSALRVSRKPQLKWPSKVTASKEAGTITLGIKMESLKNNMQTDENAFEAWILALTALGEYDEYFNCSYTVTFDKWDGDKERVEWQHYQRFLFRLKRFHDLFGSSWFTLSDENLQLAEDCEYITAARAASLKCNIGAGERGIRPTEKSGDSLSESALEWLLCKDGEYGSLIHDTFKTKKVFRQFPIGIFKDKVSKAPKNSLFPSGKACIDLVASGNDSSFWIIELKKKGNKALGIVSELLFYSYLVSDMITGKIDTSIPPKDKDCYNPAKLKGKKSVNACFLAPDFHPLLLNSIIDKLNKAFEDINAEPSVTFHKAVLDISTPELAIPQEMIWPNGGHR